MRPKFSFNSSFNMPTPLSLRLGTSWWSEETSGNCTGWNAGKLLERAGIHDMDQHGITLAGQHEHLNAQVWSTDEAASLHRMRLPVRSIAKGSNGFKWTHEFVNSMVSHIHATHTHTHTHTPFPLLNRECPAILPGCSESKLHQTLNKMRYHRSEICPMLYTQQSSVNPTSPCQCWCVASWVLVEHRCWWAPRSASYRKRPPRWRPTLGEKRPGEAGQK